MSTRSGGKSRRSGGSRGALSSSTLDETEEKELELMKLQIEEKIEEEASKEREKERQERKIRALRKVELEFEIKKGKSLRSYHSGSGSSKASTVLDNLDYADARQHLDANECQNRTQDWVNKSSADATELHTIDECSGTPHAALNSSALEPKTSTPGACAISPTRVEHSSFKRCSIIPNARDTPLRPPNEHQHPSAPGESKETICGCPGNRTSVIDDNVLSMMNTTLKLQQEHNRAVSLPPLKLSRFNGDVTNFAAFSHTFHYHVEENTNDDSRRLAMLINHLDGPPRELIEGCLELPADIGYQLAWSRLNAEYANKHDLIDSYLKKLWAWKSIDATDFGELQKYHSYLFKIECALGEDIRRLEFKEVMNRIVSKLPNYLKNKWADKATDHTTGMPRSFSYLVQFVKDEAKKAKDRSEIYDLDKKTTTPKDDKHEKPTGKKTLAIHATHAVRDSNCAFCERKGHLLNICFKFENLKNDEKWDFVTRKGLCFRCLVGHHHYSECEENTVCKHCGANSHHSVLHYVRKESNPHKSDEKHDPKVTSVKSVHDDPPTIKDTTKSVTKSSTEITDSKSKDLNPEARGSSLSISTLTSPEPDGSTMLKILPVRVSERACTYVFIDGGAVPTLVSESLVKKLGLKGTPCDQVMRTENGDFHCYEIVSLTVSGIDGGDDILLENVYVTKRLSVTTEHLMPLKWVEKWDHLQDIQLPRLPEDHHDVEIIVGLNSFLNRHIIDQRHGAENEPSAYLTRLGWVAFGPTGPKRKAGAAPLHRIACVKSLEETLQESYRQDFWESEVHSRLEDSVEDQYFLHKMSTMAQEAGPGSHYVVKLPYKYAKSLPNNLDYAKQRMNSLKKKFDSDAEYKEAYSGLIEGYISKGYAEVVPIDLLTRNDGRVWFMPHFAVVHPTKRKLRIVFDLKAKYQGVSLNDYLIQGPDLTNTLNGVILRFRNGRLALTADIAEMFHQVKVDEDGRDVFRFLWWPGGDTDQPLVEFRMGVLPFGARSSPACANYALRRTALDYDEEFSSKATSAVRDNFYVDNLLVAVDTEEEGVELSKELIGLCAAGGWRLCQWTSNSRKILDSIPESERDKSLASVDLSHDELPVERTLGIHWSMEYDHFTFKVCIKDKPHTRRGILSVVASVYDPLGFIAPFTLVAKILLQRMTKKRLGWDSKLEEVDSITWNKWLTETAKLSEFKIPRSYIPSECGDVEARELHHFADASLEGYGIASYLRIVDVNGEVHCTLLVGRSRVAPIKGSTITRLEVAAATVAARMDCTLRKELNMTIIRSVFWTDSTAVLKYINNETARFHTFVANRINLIRELTPKDSWRYVSTDLNPADMASRGLDVDALLSSDFWLNGPAFLRLGEEAWPQLPSDVKTHNLNEDPEVKKELPCSPIVEEDSSFIEELASRCGTWPKFLRLVSRIKRIRTKTSNKPKTTWITAQEMKEAEVTIWRLVQEDHYAQEKTRLDKKKTVLTSSSLIKLKPILADELIRVGGRLDKAMLSNEAKHQIILPCKSRAVELLVRSTHELHAHCGENHLLSILRENYWIVHGHSILRHVIRNCVKCKALSAQPMTQMMASLPSERVTPDTAVFSKTGTDCFGPFLVRKGRSEVKRYGLIFTCLASRAVHLEVLETMETDSFINALRRFLARRGPVKLIWCDNGSNFVGAERELREALASLDQEEVASTLAREKIEWRFTPPHASHFGGAWERLIRSTRRAMKGMCQQQVLGSDEALTTLMCEVECVINSRPLTRVTNDSKDLQPLSPSMLLTMKNPIGPMNKTCRQDVYDRKRWKQVQYLADVFWRRWSREYLPILQERQRWNTVCQDLKEEDIVLSLDEKTPRGTWPLGKVLQVFRDEDDHVRSALVKTEKGTYHRPISKLCLLLESEIPNNN